jgi:hypothetical protein
MNVKCINKGGLSLLQADISAGNTRSSVFHVSVGREYVVYGLLFRKSTISYLIQEDHGIPEWQPASLFEVMCGKPSRFWLFANWSSGGEYVGILTFADFAKNREVYEALVAKEQSSLQLFSKWKGFADLEFPRPDVGKTALALNGNWVQCVFCSEAWETQSYLALLRCPSCDRILNNPRTLETASGADSI